MDLSFDSEADAVYIQLSDREVAETTKIDERTIADLDEDEEIIGIEILDASKRFPEISSLSIDFSQEKLQA